MNMRRIVYVILVLICFCGCQKRDEFDIKFESMQTQTFKEESQYINTELNVIEISDEIYRYQVIINEPHANLDDLRAFVVCDQMIGDTVASIGFYDEDKYCLYLDKIDIENGYYEGVSLMGLASEKEMTCHLYISFNVDNRFIEEYIELRSE